MAAADKERIDKILVQGNFAESRAKAQAMIMAGIVLVGEQRVSKPSEMFAPDSVVRLKGVSEESRYVSRGGLKLEAALKAFSVDPAGMTCIDVGSSTGGFTDCLLKHGAESVAAVDAGTNQLVWELRNDPRIEVRENTNARYLDQSDFDRKFDLAVMDVSFISVEKVIPAILELLKPTGKLIVLIKPQFEVGRGDVGKGGIVRDPEKHKVVLDKIKSFALTVGLCPGGVIDSPIHGAEGNKEFLAIYTRS